MVKVRLTQTGYQLSGQVNKNQSCLSTSMEYLSALKIRNLQTPESIAIIKLNLMKRSYFKAVCPKDDDGMANGEDPDPLGVVCDCVGSELLA